MSVFNVALTVSVLPSDGVSSAVLPHGARRSDVLHTPAGAPAGWHRVCPRPGALRTHTHIRCPPHTHTHQVSSAHTHSSGLFRTHTHRHTDRHVADCVFSTRTSSRMENQTYATQLQNKSKCNQLQLLRIVFFN